MLIMSHLTYRFAYGVQMAGLGLKSVYYWQFHIWRDLFCHLPKKMISKAKDSNDHVITEVSTC